MSRGNHRLLRAEKILTHLILQDERFRAASALRNEWERHSEENKAIGALQYWADEARDLLGLPKVYP